MQSARTWLKPITKLAALILVFFGMHAWGQSITTSALAQQYACTSCHSENTKSLGPSWASIRQKYGSQDFSYLTKKILNGSMGVWGSLPMPGNSRMSQSDAETLVVAMGFKGGASASNTASSSASQPSQATTQPTTTNNQAPQFSASNITAECDQEQSRIISKATTDAKALVATGDLAGMQRIQLVRNIAMRDLYSGGRCAGATNATARREQAQKFINMDQRFCQQWGMGSQCAAPPVLVANKPTNTTPSNSQDESTASSNAAGKQSIERVDKCIDIRNTHIQGNDAQWYRVTNTCSSAIKFYSANNSERYGNLKNLAPGQTDTSWWSLRTKSSLPWVACPEKSTSGKDVRLDESTTNSLVCFYYN